MSNNKRSFIDINGFAVCEGDKVKFFIDGEIIIDEVEFIGSDVIEGKKYDLTYIDSITKI